MSDPLKAFADRLAALGHQARLEIVRLLLSQPGGLVVRSIQERVGLPASTLAHHLDTLQREGLVSSSREGRFVRYTASDTCLEELAGFLRGRCATRAAPFVERRQRGPWGA